MADEDQGDIGDVFDFQLQQQGTACVRVDDGHVFAFTEKTLVKLLEVARQNDRKQALVFVKHGCRA